MRVFTRLTVAAALAGLAVAVVSRGAHAAECADLARAKLDGATVQSAHLVAAGPFDLPTDAGTSGRPLELPAFCRVQGRAAGSIGYEVWLPASGWNGALLSVGNGGFGGAVPLADLGRGLRLGYAVTGNDTGHQGQDRAWMRDREKVRFWGHSATHLVTGPAKALVAAYYDRAAAHAYFQGCSTGGAQAMEEAEFYPGDYDGVVAGAPGMSYTHLMLSFLWGLKAAERPGGFLPPQTLAVLHKAVLDACDADDGARDGLIGDPPACRFDPGKLLCKAGDEAGCLTPAQVETARLIYQGPRNARTGAALYPGFAFGSEADPAASKAEALFYGWTAIQGPLARMFAIPLLQEMVYQDPKWDWRSFDWDSDVADLDRRISADITATDPDLRAFARRGGKLIMYQGWGDPLNGQTLPIQYRDAVIEVFSTGGAPRAATRTVDGFFRVFMAPGMGHCAGGPGPSQFDALTAVRAWVETGRAPRVLIAVRAPRTGLPDPGPPPMSRPLCPFPGVARWRGTGDVNAAETWRCVVSR